MLRKILANSAEKGAEEATDIVQSFIMLSSEPGRHPVITLCRQGAEMRLKGAVSVETKQGALKTGKFNKENETALVQRFKAFLDETVLEKKP